MLGSTTKKTSVILSVLVLVACAGIYGMYFMISKAGHKVAAYELQQQKLISELEVDRSLKLFLSTSGSDIDKLSSRIIPREGTVSFLEMIEKNARDIGLVASVESVNVGEAPTLPADFEILKLKISTEGSWGDTYRFLSLLETLPYKITINTVEVRQRGEGGPSETSSNNSALWIGEFSFNVIKYK